jgi:cyclophilin family peptidyl-prolyl cis-trans isomerase
MEFKPETLSVFKFSIPAKQIAKNIFDTMGTYYNHTETNETIIHRTDEHIVSLKYTRTKRSQVFVDASVESFNSDLITNTRVGMINLNIRTPTEPSSEFFINNYAEQLSDTKYVQFYCEIPPVSQINDVTEKLSSVNLTEQQFIDIAQHLVKWEIEPSTIYVSMGDIAPHLPCDDFIISASNYDHQHSIRIWFDTNDIDTVKVSIDSEDFRTFTFTQLFTRKN